MGSYLVFALYSILVFSIGYTTNHHEVKEGHIQIPIRHEMDNRPVKYKDEFSFGYSTGLIKCSRIVREVFERQNETK